MLPAQCVLVVEDHPDIADIVTLHMRQAGFNVEVARDGSEALEKIAASSPDVLILDLMLPKIDGLTVCRTLRQKYHSQVPIVMLSAKGLESEIVQGLEAGADDYVVKPFKPGELVARVRAVLRRVQGGVATLGRHLTHEGIEVNLDLYEVRINGQLQKFTLTEFQLLVVLLQGRGKIYTRDQLIDRVKGQDVFIVDRNVDVHMSAIRKKLGVYGKLITTVRGVGYRFGEGE